MQHEKELLELLNGMKGNQYQIVKELKLLNDRLEKINWNLGYIKKAYELMEKNDVGR